MSSLQLKAFHAVARFGSFSAAAERLALTQPAISDHVRKLETAHGTRLFERGPKGATLTGIGRKLYAITERLAEAEAEAEELLSRARRLEEGELAIGADAAVHVLPLVGRFRARFPRIGIRLTGGNSDGLIQALRNFAIDFAVAAKRPAEADIGAIRLRQDRMIAVAAASRRASTITLAGLANETLILREPGSTTREIVLGMLARAGVTPRERLEIEGREASQEAVAQGLGLAVISEGELGPDSRLMKLTLADASDTMEEWLLYLKSRASLRLIEAFLDSIPAA